MAREVVEQIIDQLDIPTAIDRPELLGAAALVAAGVMAAQSLRHRRAEEAFAVDFPNPSLLEHTIRATAGSKGFDTLRASGRRRLGPSFMMMGGLALAGGSHFADPRIETLVPDESAATVVIMDSSLSMLNTTDMGGKDTSRYEAALGGLNRIDYEGSLGVVSFAANQAVSVPLTHNWRSGMDTLTSPSVNPNGGNLAPALELAASLLPTETDEGQTGTRRGGNILLISDGTVEDAPEVIAAQAKTLRERGIGVNVVVPGAKEATYTVGGSEPVSSGARTDIFSVLTEQELASQDNAEELAESIDSVIDRVGKRTQENPWLPPVLVGGLLFAGGLIKDTLQRARRVV